MPATVTGVVVVEAAGPVIRRIDCGVLLNINCTAALGWHCERSI